MTVRKNTNSFVFEVTVRLTVEIPAAEGIDKAVANGMAVNKIMEGLSNSGLYEVTEIVSYNAG